MLPRVRERTRRRDKRREGREKREEKGHRRGRKRGIEGEKKEARRNTASRSKNAIFTK